jgi:lysophospholipase L1-like esterase
MVSLFLTLVIAEAVARAVLPRTQLVEVEEIEKRESRGGPMVEREDERGINVLLEFRENRSVRVNPNVRATIRNHDLSRRDIVIETNSLGIRHAELGPKADDEFRVLVIGDSITFGDYVQYDETYTAMLEERLSGRSRRIVVINAGVPGASTSDELIQYLEIREAVDPDLVLVGMYLNDVQDSHRFYARRLPRPYASSRFLGWIVNRFDGLRNRIWVDDGADAIDPGWREEFRAGRDLRSGDMLHDRDGFDFEIYNASKDFGLAWNPESWPILQREMRVFALAADEAGHRFGVFLFPVHFQVKGTVDGSYPQEQFLAMCGTLDLACLDLLPALRADWSSGEPRQFYDHCHLTPHGNGVVADAVVEWLDDQALVPR